MRQRIAPFAGLALLFSFALSGVARAQESLPQRVLEHFGETVQLEQDPSLQKALYDRGLVTKGRNAIKIDDAFFEKVLGNERLYNEQHSIRYHVGDRVWMETNGVIDYRGEIAAIHDDGTYDVTVWDRPTYSVPNPTTDITTVDAGTGHPPAGTAPETILKSEPDGSTREITTDAPWLERGPARTVRITHADLDRLNGLSDPKPGQARRVPGLAPSYALDVDILDLENDPVLRKAVEDAMARVDTMIQSGALDPQVPEDPAARKVKLAEIAAAQRKLILDTFEAHPMAYGYPGEKESRKLGDYLAAAQAKCTSATMVLTAILREVGRRVGFDVRPIRGDGHSFFTVRTAEGAWSLIDPAGAVLGSKFLKMTHPDLAANDARGSYMNTYYLADGHPRAFMEPTPEVATPITQGAERAALERGYTPAMLATLEGKKAAAGTGSGKPATATATIGLAGALGEKLAEREHAATAADLAEAR